MKQNLLQSLRLRFALLVALLCSLGTGTAWATDLVWSHTFASPEAISSNTITVSGATWTVSTTAGEGSPEMSTGTYSKTYGLKFGSSKSAYYGSVTFTTDYFSSYNVKSITVNILNNGSKAGTLTAQQGATSIGSTTSTFGQSWTDLTVNTNAGSGGTFSFTYSVEQAFLIHSISVTYEEQAAAVAKPTFSVAAGTYTAVQNVTISCATDGAAIHYTTDGNTPTSESTLYTGAVTIDHTCTLKAIAIKGEDASNVTTAAYTINLPTNYNLASTITSGKHYLITNGKANGSVKVLDLQNANNRGSIDATITGGVLQATGARELVIQGPDADGNYTIYDPTQAGYLYAASSASNYLRTSASLDGNGNSYWSIEIDESGNATIKAQGNNSRNWLRNNGSLFSCYGSGQSDVYLFEKAGEATPDESVTVTSAGYATYASNNALDFTGKGIEAYIATPNKRTGVTFTRKYKIPARTGVLLHADGGATVDIPSLAGGTDADDVTGNIFVKGTGAAVASVVETTKHNYILNIVDDVLGFYRAAGNTVAANRAYIQIDWSEVGEVKEFISIDFDSIVDGIGDVRSKMDDVRGEIFNLAGQKMSRLQKGINIVNGRKVLVK